MKITTFTMELTQRMISTAILPIKMALHPIHTTQKALKTLKETSDGILLNVKSRIPFIAPSNNTPSHSNSTTNSDETEKYGVTEQFYILLRICYSYIMSPLKAVLAKRDAALKNEDTPNKFSLLQCITSLFDQLVLFLFTSNKQTNKPDTQKPSNKTNQAIDNGQLGTGNKNIDYDNEYNHKTEYLTKLSRKKRGVSNSAQPRKVTAVEDHTDKSLNNEAVDNDGPKLNLKLTGESKKVNTSDKNHKDALLKHDIKVCVVCGFESQNMCSTACSERDNFEYQRLQYKSQINSLLKRIRDTECEKISTSGASTSKTEKNKTKTQKRTETAKNKM